ncbi:hypothetical protein E2320_001314, partial [Naja naja]
GAGTSGSRAPSPQAERDAVGGLRTTWPEVRAEEAGRSPGARMAVCIAVIAKENYPLYIKSLPTENELKFHYTVHTSLDVVDEKVSALGKALVDQRELYLGLLYPTEDYKVSYGYVTNSKVKFVMVVDSSNTALRDNEIRSVSLGHLPESTLGTYKPFCD